MTKLWMALGGVEEEFDDRTMFELAQSIDRLNAQFLEKMKSGEFVALMNDEWNKNPESYKPVRDDPLDYPICSIVWNRLNPEESATNSCNGYRVKYVHGHTKFSEILPTHIIGIDDNFGKGLNLKVDNEELGFCVTRRIPKECIADFIAIRDTLEPTFIKLKAIRDKNRAKHQYEVVADINESFTRIKNIIVAHLDGNIDRIHPEIKKELENLSEKIQQRKNASSGKKLFGASRSSSSWAIKELSARLDMGKLKVKSLPGR